MTRFGRLAACAVTGLGLAIACDAQAGTMLSGALTADNAFFAYISTNPNDRGTLIASGGDWGQTYSFANATLTAGVTNYLHIEVINYGGPYGLLGSLSLSGTDYAFANGSQTLNTDATNWQSSLYSTNNQVTPQPWVNALGTSTGTYVNGQGPWGFHTGIAATALWITNAATDSSFNGGNFTMDYSTTITYVGAAAPEPASLALFAAGLAALGLAYRRKRLIGGW